MHRSTVYLALVLLAFLASAPLPASEEAATPPTTFKILLREAGVYRIRHAELVEAGLDPGWDGQGVRLTNRGIEVPLYRPDRPHRFGPGESIIFRGEALRGEHFFFNDHTDVNVYVLELGGADGPTMRTLPPPTDAAAATTAAPLERLVHLEHDELLLRFNERQDAPPKDGWFWAKLTQIDKEPFRLPLDLTDFEPANGPLSITIALRGWSYRRGNQDDEPDHVVEVAINGKPLATSTFPAQEEHLVEIPVVDPSLLQPGENVLTLDVPQRKLEDGEDLIDVALFNWIELRYGRDPVLREDQQHLVVRGSGHQVVRLQTSGESSVTAFGSDGSRRPATSAHGGSAAEHLIAVDAASDADLEITTVVDGAFREPLVVAADTPSALRSSDNRADYIIIAHSSLLAAIEPLAAFHRSRGLVVEVVDAVDVYDEFNDGILHPSAIRDFLSFAYREWEHPAPRFVLLVGDASWDTKNQDPYDRQYADWTYRPGEVERFVKNQSTEYESEFKGALRNLIPTWSYYSAQGHAASDNYFVAIEGDDYLPDMAIGRLPVVSPEEVDAIVTKTIDYMTSSPVGPWRRDLLWITNESKGFQLRSDKLFDTTAKRGFAGYRIYPSPEEADNEHHQQQLLDALDGGKLLVHFLGHGGRYIWRTGPPDFRKNHDLFTLDHLDELEPTTRMPMVLSMTCYSAPFDHPKADSIGEKFLRISDRGAIAVFAASWRNSPNAVFSSRLIEELLEQPTVGEAIVATKREVRRRDLIETYNLLGDPALQLAKPAFALELVRSANASGDQVTIDVAPGTSALPSQAGTLLLTWTDAEGQVAYEQEIAVQQFPVALAEPTADAALKTLQAYFWNADARLDAIGSLDLDPAVEAQPQP